MKKKILAMFAIAALAFGLAGCGGGSDTIVISDRFFVQEINDLVLNHQQNLGRTIEYEGLFLSMGDGERYMVLQFLWSCCGIEPFGFFVDIGDRAPFEDLTWVAVSGTLTMSNNELTLDVISIVEAQAPDDIFTL